MQTQINSAVVAVSALNIVGTPIPGVVGWTYEQVAGENKDRMREERIRNLSRKRTRRAAPKATRPSLLAETGWTDEAALEMALECRAELAGRRYH